MTESQIDQIIESMPDGSSGFLKSWGLRQFAHSVKHFILTTQHEQNKSNWVDRWIDSRVPPSSEKGEHFPISVLVVVDDSKLRLNGELPFIDIASYWPALKKWTVTYCSVADETATDYEVRVTRWMPLPDF